MAGVDPTWSFGEIICRGSGILGISGFEIFVHNNLSEAPFLTVPVTDPFGPTWNFPLTSIPAAAGHAFDTGQIHVNWLDLTGQSAGSVRLSTAGFARVSSEIKASDGSSDAEFDFIFDDGFEAGDTSAWCVDVKVPNDGRSVGDVKVMLGDEEFTLVNNAFVNSILDPTRRSAFECFTGASATAFNPRDPSVTFSTEMTLGGEVLTGTGGPCIAIEFIDDLPGTEMSTTLCLSDDRFKAEVTWEDFQGLGALAIAAPLTAIAAPLTDEEGIFVFVNPEDSVPNKLLVNVANGCGVNGAYWVFAGGGAANVGFTLTVRDTVSGQSVSWANPDGLRFPPIMDTSLFSTCP